MAVHCRLDSYSFLCVGRLLLAVLGYFGLGAYYNYSTYGATGVDLIPYVLTLAIPSLCILTSL